jgi:hemoglobin
MSEPASDTPFARLGGEPGVRALVDRFYDEMDRSPSAREIRSLHPSDLATSRDKLFWFLCGWLGGPQHYVQRFGHPRLRARHLPFAIGDLERDQWMTCMGAALVACCEDPELRGQLEPAFRGLADHMRNRATGE